MPAKEIMRLFKAGKLHSGGSGKIVKNPKQAKAIQLSYLRKEGHDIPEKREGPMVKAFRKARKKS
jgi:hypothetical protein